MNLPISTAVAATIQRSLTELVRDTNELYAEVEKARGHAERACNLLGQMLAEAKRRKPKGITWPAFVKENYDFSRSRADELIQIAEERTTVEKAREGKNASVKKSRAKSTLRSVEPPLRSGGSNVVHLKSDPIQEPCTDCSTAEEFWQRSLGNLAGDAISIRAFWTRQFGEWEKFETPSSLVTLAKQAAEVWTKLAADLSRRSRNG